MDREAVVEAAVKTGKVLVIHEDNKTGGFGGEVVATIAEEALFDLDAPIQRLCGPDVPAMPYNPILEKEFMLNKDKIANAIRELAEF